MKDKVCMVIGNGEMGKVAAQTLMETGADVTVTVRQYRSGMVASLLDAKGSIMGNEWSICQSVIW